MDIFVSASAQEENIGDMVLRREILRWLDVPKATLHVYLGDMPAGYVAGLCLGEDCTYDYRSIRKWLKAFSEICSRVGKAH